MLKIVEIKFELAPMLEHIDNGEMERRITKRVLSELFFGGLGSTKSLSVKVSEKEG